MIRVLGFKGEELALPVEKKQEGNHITLRVSAAHDYRNVRFVELDYFGEAATNQESGYLVLPRGAGNEDYSLFYLDRHVEDFSKEITKCQMPFFGIKTENKAYLVIISGMSYDYRLQIALQDGKYRIYPVFDVYGEQLPEDIRLEIFELRGDDADYSGMARCYRKWKTEAFSMVPLAQRIKTDPILDYTLNSVMIRIRCGWKPAPSPVPHQTLENEPAMHVACDFDRVGDILEELKAQGIEKAEICLVGWNVKGHDGRWPQAFPVCEELGGEEKLKALIRKGQQMGYQITCHTNHTDQYEIADCYSKDNCRLNRQGNPTGSGAWSGGEMSYLCPKIGCEQGCALLPKVAELGFRGSHYIDVLGVVFPERCFHPDHYANSKETVEYAKRLCDTSRNLFGGVSSEGALDFIAPYLNYALYISFARDTGFLCDKSIPFWQLVYHGYVLSNPFPQTINATLKTRADFLKFIEYGGRPTYYFYSKFTNNGNHWMGVSDPVCGTDTELQESVEKIKVGYRAYEALVSLQTQFMEKHEKVAENVYEVTYSDGTIVRVDYEKEYYEVKRASSQY